MSGSCSRSRSPPRLLLVWPRTIAAFAQRRRGIAAAHTQARFGIAASDAAAVAAQCVHRALRAAVNARMAAGNANGGGALPRELKMLSSSSLRQSWLLPRGSRRPSRPWMGARMPRMSAPRLPWSWRVRCEDWDGDGVWDSDGVLRRVAQPVWR